MLFLNSGPERRRITWLFLQATPIYFKIRRTYWQLHSPEGHFTHESHHHSKLISQVNRGKCLNYQTERKSSWLRIHKIRTFHTISLKILNTWMVMMKHEVLGLRGQLNSFQHLNQDHLINIKYISRTQEIVSLPSSLSTTNSAKLHHQKIKDFRGARNVVLCRVRLGLLIQGRMLF